MTTPGVSHAVGDLSDTTGASVAGTLSRSDCIAEAADLLAVAIQEQVERVAVEGVAAAARAAGCVSDAEVAAWRDRFFPTAPLVLREAS